jgi:hypothetical protein
MPSICTRRAKISIISRKRKNPTAKRAYLLPEKEQLSHRDAFDHGTSTWTYERRISKSFDAKIGSKEYD